MQNNQPTIAGERTQTTPLEMLIKICSNAYLRPGPHEDYHVHPALIIEARKLIMQEEGKPTPAVQNPEYLLLRFKQAEEVIYECFEFIEGLSDGAPHGGPLARSANHLMGVLDEAGYTYAWAEIHAGETLPNDGKEGNQMPQDIAKREQRMRRLLREIETIQSSIAILFAAKGTDCSEMIARLESDLEAARADLLTV